MQQHAAASSAATPVATIGGDAPVLSGFPCLWSCKPELTRGDQRRDCWALLRLLLVTLAALTSHSDISCSTLLRLWLDRCWQLVQLKAARIVELLWQRRNATLSDVVSSTETMTTSTGQSSQAKVKKLGKDILKDYQTVSIGQSAYFTGTLVSTCYFQLWLSGLLISSIITLLLHPSFWEFVGDYVGWPISIFFIICWHIASQLTLNRWVTDGKTIKKPFLWLFAYVTLSTAYCVVRTAASLALLGGHECTDHTS